MDAIIIPRRNSRQLFASKISHSYVFLVGAIIIPRPVCMSGFLFAFKKGPGSFPSIFHFFLPVALPFSHLYPLRVHGHPGSQCSDTRYASAWEETAHCWRNFIRVCRVLVCHTCRSKKGHINVTHFSFFLNVCFYSLYYRFDMYKGVIILNCANFLCQ